MAPPWIFQGGANAPPWICQGGANAPLGFAKGGPMPPLEFFKVGHFYFKGGLCSTLPPRHMRTATTVTADARHRQ